MSPLLFILAINDAPLSVRKGEILIFADDTKTYTNITSSNDRSLLQDDLNSFVLWCDKNSLNLPKKVSKKRPHTSYCSTILQHILNYVRSFKELGVVLSNNLDFCEHINSIVKKANSMLGFIKCLAKEFRDPNVTTALVRPNLKYRSQVYTLFYENQIER